MRRYCLLGATIMEMTLSVVVISAIICAGINYYKQIQTQKQAKLLRDDIITVKEQFTLADKMGTVYFRMNIPNLPKLSQPIVFGGSIVGDSVWVFNRPQGAMWTMGTHVSAAVCQLATADLISNGFVGPAPWWIPGQASCTVEVY